MGDSERTVKLSIKETSRSSAKRPVLVVIQGPSIGMTFPLVKDKTVIGRGSSADVVLRDEIASRMHAEVLRHGSQDDCFEYYINDLGSTNGTFLNGTVIKSEQLLQDGDKIELGKHLLKFAMLDEYEAEFQEQLHRMTTRDELTGLRSRRSLFADLDRVVNREIKSSHPHTIVVLMMDLDYFKRVNDKYGHLVGSQTIREVGKILREMIGDEDHAGRYGGEEFYTYFLGSREKGLELAEKIREEVRAHPFEIPSTGESKPLHITISIGMATFPFDGPTALELVQKSDLALYRAKEEGRNRVCVYDPELDKPNSSRGGTDLFAIISGPADAQ